MLKTLKVFISLTFALMAAMLGVFAVAMVKAIVPIFQFTEGTRFQVYIQDPILYTLGPLYCGYMAFRGVMSKSMNERVLKSTALGVAAGIVTTIVGTFAIPFRNFEGPLRWLLILAQFPIIPFVVAYIVYRITLMIYLAADQGQADAQFNLGGRYINGEGVPQDDTHQGVRPMVVEDYSLDRILQRARAASPTGEISPATRERLETLSRQLEEANKELEEYQEKQAWKEAQRAVDQIREEVAREERKAGRKQTQAELDAEFDGLAKDLGKLLADRKSPEEAEAWFKEGKELWRQRRHAEAAACFKPVAEQGHAAAQDALGSMYAWGYGVPRDWAQAAAWWRKAAEQGNAEAQGNFGMAYAAGMGVPQDYAQAALWWRRAAEQGDAYAQGELGYLYALGKGVPRDYAQAILWLRKAAEQGLPNAQHNLGVSYRDGYGVPQDHAEAYFWFAVAAAGELGTPSAKDVAKDQDEVASHLTPADLARVQERARKWFEAHPAKPQ